jgi:phosphoribosylpyrophosphate synthetase
MSETYSEDLRFRLVDSRELVFVGCTLEDVVSSVFTLLFVEDLLLKAFRGAAKQLATATHGIFTGGARQRERKDFSP